MPSGGGKGKGKEEEPVLSYHGVGYIDLSPLLYPGGESGAERRGMGEEREGRGRGSRGGRGEGDGGRQGRERRGRKEMRGTRRVRNPWGRLGRQKERYVSVAVSPPWL